MRPTEEYGFPSYRVGDVVEIAVLSATGQWEIVGPVRVFRVSAMDGSCELRWLDGFLAVKRCAQMWLRRPRLFEVASLKFRKRVYGLR